MHPALGLCYVWSSHASPFWSSPEAENLGSSELKRSNLLSNIWTLSAARFPPKPLSSLYSHTSNDRKLITPTRAFPMYSRGAPLENPPQPRDCHVGGPITCYLHLWVTSSSPFPSEWSRYAQFPSEPWCGQGREALLHDTFVSSNFYVLIWALNHLPFFIILFSSFQQESEFHILWANIGSSPFCNRFLNIGWFVSVTILQAKYAQFL